MKTKLKAVISIVAGLVITAVTGLISLSVLLGATHYGLPLVWRIELVTFPPVTNIEWINLIADVIIWSAIVFLVLHFMKKEKKK
jgi:hypothetical protein